MMCFEKTRSKSNTIISVLNAYYRDITKIMRIACVLDNLNCKHALITQKEGR